MSDKQQEPGTIQEGAAPIRLADGAPYDVPVEGSLPLLALGYRGLMAWRAKRAQAEPNNATKP